MLIIGPFGGYLWTVSTKASSSNSIIWDIGHQGTNSNNAYYSYDVSLFFFEILFYKEIAQNKIYILSQINKQL